MTDVADRPAHPGARVGTPADPRELDRDIWRMAWPAMLSFMLTNVIDLIDVAFVGRLGRDSMAAYGYCAQYLHLFNMLIQSVGIGCVALMSRSLGARQKQDSAREIMAATLIVSLLVALVALAVVWATPAFWLRLLGAKADVIERGVPYFRTSLASTLIFAVSFTFESGLRAHKLTRIPMKVTLAVAVVKMTASYGLIFGKFGLPALGLIGAAWSTVLAHAVGMLLYVAAARAADREGLVMMFDRTSARAAGPASRQVFAVSLPAMGERFVMSTALLTYYALLSDYGTAAVAAYAIGVRLLAFSWVPGLGFAAAAATFVGQALGAGDVRGARRAGWRALRMAFLVMTVLGCVCLVAREPLARLFTNDAQVVLDLLPFMTMLAVAQPFMGAHFTLGGVLRGAGETMTPFVGAAIGNWGFRVPLAYAYAKVLGLTLPWVWSALIADHVARTLVCGLAFLRGRWVDRLGAPK